MGAEEDQGLVEDGPLVVGTSSVSPVFGRCGELPSSSRHPPAITTRVVRIRIASRCRIAAPIRGVWRWICRTTVWPGCPWGWTLNRPPPIPRGPRAKPADVRLTAEPVSSSPRDGYKGVRRFSPRRHRAPVHGLERTEVNVTTPLCPLPASRHHPSRVHPVGWFAACEAWSRRRSSTAQPICC